MTIARSLARSINLLLVFLPISVLLSRMHGVNSLWVFVAAALAIIPLAGLMGQATEELALHLGSTWGGLLNATFGNATELIIGLIALHSGYIQLVQASIIGSIIGNLLLVLGASILAGGLRHKIQTFNRDQAEMHAINLILASLSLALPAIFAISFHRASTPDHPDPNVMTLSVCVSAILLIIYIASLFFSLRTHESLFQFDNNCDPSEKPSWSKLSGFVVLAAATILVAGESDILVASVKGTVAALNINQAFIGIIIVAVIGNAAEHSTSIALALKNKMDVTMNIAIGSSTQVAMFVAPLLVFGSLLLHHPMTFIFSVPELTAITFSVVITAFIAGDGRCHWLEGAQLLAAYAIIALCFYFLPF